MGSIRLQNLTEGEIKGRLLRLALPIIGTSFVQMAYSFTDMAWLGRLGSKSVAAIGIVAVLTWLSSSISSINKTGSEVTIGHSLGKGAIEEARRYASHNVSMSLLISSVIALLFFLFPHLFLSIYHLEDDVHALALTYLRIVACGLPFTFAATAFSGIYNGAGLSSIPFKVSSTGLVLNMILDPLLIFGLGWGTIGAAIATLIAQVFVFVLFIYRLRRQDKLLDCFPFFVRPDNIHSGRILRIGLPVAALNSLFAIINMMLGRLASQQGGHIGVATLTTGGQLEAITWNTSQGFSTALATFVAHNYAARQGKRIFSAYRYTLLYCSIFGILGTVLFVFFGNEVFRLVVPEKEAYLSGGIYLRISGYSQLLMMLEIATQGLFYGTARTVFPAVISIGGNLLRIPLALLLIGMGFGPESVWWAISLSSMLKGLAIVCGLPYLNRRIKLHSQLLPSSQ